MAELLLPQVAIGRCYIHVIKSVEYIRTLVTGSSDTSFQLNERQCQFLAQELVKTSAFLKQEGYNSSKLDQAALRTSLRHLCAAVQRAELLVKKCCCKDSKSWLVAAMMLVEIQEDFMAIILEIHLWKMLLQFAITWMTRDWMTREEKAEEMKMMDEEYHQLFKELRKESHALRQAAVEDKSTVISKISTIVDFHGSSNELEYLKAVCMQSWLTGNASQQLDTELRRYESMHKLGQGGCGIVLKVRWLGVECALKMLGSQDAKEATALKGLLHPNIIRFFHYWEDPPNKPQSHILMELMPEDLGTHMENRLKSMPISSKDVMPFSFPVAIDIMYQIAQAMQYMHDVKHLTHRDLKPSNILVKKRPNAGWACFVHDEGYLDIKLADFGLVKPYENTSTAHGHTLNTGTRLYQAPEVFDKDFVQERHYLPKADIWSFGITCATILTGKHPYFEYENESRLITQSRVLENGLRPTLPKHCPQYMEFCIRSCWELLPQRRPTFANICNLLRHARFLSLGVTDLDESKFLFAYTTRCGQVTSLPLSSSGARFPTFLQPSSPGLVKSYSLGAESSGLVKSSFPGLVKSSWNRFVRRFSKVPKLKDGEETGNAISIPGKGRDWNATVILRRESLLSSVSYTFKELSDITNKFGTSELLSSGGFGDVFKGTLPSGDLVAVKRIKGKVQAGEESFLAEVETLQQTRHRNLLQLRGWCHSPDGLCLVYDFMCNGSLSDRLHPNGDISWDVRRHILAGVASGLKYLHEDVSRLKRVLHRGIKSSNVLLDADFNAYVGDFGLALLMDHRRMELTTTLIAGTLGYMAPEMITGKASKETDVYAFGILVLEAVCGRKPLYTDDAGTEKLVDIVWRAHESGRIGLVVDPRLAVDVGSHRDEDGAANQMVLPKGLELPADVLHVGLLCSHADPVNRPSMQMVDQWFQSREAIALPPLPPSEHTASSLTSSLRKLN